MAVPRQICRRFARTSRRIEVSRDALARLGRTQLATIFSLADGDIAGREIREYGRTRQRGIGARRNRRPDILTNLDVQPEPFKVLRLENQVVPEGDAFSEKRNFAADGMPSRSELALLIEFAVIWQIGFRDETEDRAAIDHHGAVE